MTAAESNTQHAWQIRDRLLRRITADAGMKKQRGRQRSAVRWQEGALDILYSMPNRRVGGPYGLDIWHLGRLVFSVKWEGENQIVVRFERGGWLGMLR